MNNSKNQNKWICQSEKTLLASPVMDVLQRDCVSSEDQRKHRFFVLRSKEWCNIIPVTCDGKVVMVRQYRIGISDHTLEVPGGVSDSTDPDIQATALREMTEETGYSPLPGAKCLSLGWNFPNPAIQDNRCHSFVVGPVARSTQQKLDAGEMIEVAEVSIEQIPELIKNGTINHALMLYGFLKLSLDSTSGADGLVQRLKEFTRV